MPASRLHLAATLALLVAACAPPAATVAPTATASVTTSPPPATATPATNAPPSAPAGALAMPTQFAVELEPGTYFSSPPFELGFIFDVDEPGWFAGHLNDEFFDLQRYEGEAMVGVTPIRMVGFGHPALIRGRTGNVPVSELTPRGAVDLLAARDDLESANVEDVELAGQMGSRLDLHSDQANNPLFGGEDGVFGLGPELDARLIVLPIDEGFLLMIVLAPPGELGDAWEEAQAIFESVELVG